MQIVRYERWDRRFFCPVTGQPVFNDDGEVVAPTFRGLWIAEVIDEPTIAMPELEVAWSDYVARVDASDDEDGLDANAFLGSVESDSLVAFCVTSCGMACGPVSETMWVVLDVAMEIDEEE